MSIADFYSLIFIADTPSNDFGFYNILIRLMFLPGIPLISYLMYKIKIFKNDEKFTRINKVKIKDIGRRT